MPSKVQHEIDKVRGRVSATNKIYDDSIAALKDALTAAEVSIKALESDEIDNTSKINNALSMSRNAIKSAKASIKRTGDVLEGTFFPDVQDKYTLGFLGREWGNIYSSVVTAKNYIKTDTINEYTTSAGVTIGGGFRISNSQLNRVDGDADDISMAFSYNGYQNGVTRFRDTAIYNGKHALIIFADGSSKETKYYGNITFNGAETVDGRDLSVDGAKLDGVDSGADVTGSNPPQAHGASVHTDRTRSMFISTPMPASTGGTQHYGVTLDKDADETAIYTFKLPSDFVSISTVKAVYKPMLAIGLPKTVVFDSLINFGAIGEATNAHSTNTDGTSETINDGNIDSITLPSAAFNNITSNDFVTIEINRDADNGSDDYGYDWIVMGILITYTADM